MSELNFAEVAKIIDENDSEKELSILKDYINTKWSSREICKIKNDDMAKLKELYNNCFINPKEYENTKEQGNALEEISAFLLSCTGLFEVKGNVRTNTNELDIVVELSPFGRTMVSCNAIDKRLTNFICECKNYKTKVNITYVGKLASLLLSTGLNFSILFSRKGVTGKSWTEAAGLIKKVYMSEKNKPIIIDFNSRQFEQILNGNSFLDIINEQIRSLLLDTDYITSLSSHEKEADIKQFTS